MQRILSLFVQIMSHTKGNKEFYLLLLVFSPMMNMNLELDLS